MKLIIKQPRKKGFTLIELLVVMAIIASLAAIGFGVFNKLRESAKEKETKVLLANIKQNMEAVQEQTGAPYPISSGTDTTKLVAYLTGTYDYKVDFEVKAAMPELLEGNGKTKFLRGGKIVDSWGNEIEYIHKIIDGLPRGEKNNFEGGFDLKSKGRDPDKTQDDIEL